MNDLPDVISWYDGDWVRADDCDDFRVGLVLGVPTVGWSHEEAQSNTMDVYKRTDPLSRDVKWAIFRLCDDSKVRRVGSTPRKPDLWLLRELAEKSVRNGYDIIKARDQYDIERAALLAEQEKRAREETSEALRTLQGRPGRLYL